MISEPSGRACGRPIAGKPPRNDGRAVTISNVRDDRDVPFVGDETAGFVGVIWGAGEGENFCGEAWTERIGLNSLRKITCSDSVKVWDAGPVRAAPPSWDQHLHGTSIGKTFTRPEVKELIS